MSLPPQIWRCPCGAMLSSPKARDRHVAGETVCQHWGDGLATYQLLNVKRPGAADTARGMTKGV